jgi:hypothetical protein
MYDRGVSVPDSANRRNMLPLAGEVMQIQKYHCLFAA